MSSVSSKPVESEVVIAESNSPEVAPAGYKIFNRIVDWITSDRTQLINVTDRINDIVRKSGIRDGIVHLQSLHTTTAVFINEWQDALLHDVKHFLRGMMMGQSLCLQVRNSSVLLGTWQSIILAEFDGPRSRSVSIQVSGV